MSEFKVGDWVIRNSCFANHLSVYYHNTPEPFQIKGFTATLSVIDPNGSVHDPAYLEFWEGFETNKKGPIQEVKTKQIVEGVYGIVIVEVPFKQPANLKIAFSKYCNFEKPTIADLRSLEKIAKELADFMEEYKDDYGYN